MRIRGLYVLPCLLILAIISVACSDRPDNVLDRESMARLLADFHKGEGVIQSNQRYFPTDSSKRAFRQSIYVKHGVTSDQVYASLDWYGYHVEEFDEVYNRTIEILGEELTEAQRNIGSASELALNSHVSMEGDSVDVWPSIRYRRLAANMPGDYLKFDLSSDRFWDRADVYTLRAKLSGVKAPVDYVLAVDYFDGSSEYVAKKIPGAGWHEVAIALDSAKVARQVYGYINYVPKNEVAFIDSISLIRTRWGGHYRYLRDDVNLMKSVR